jgi:glutamate-1-semialdehyde 2,1-aminomutase
MEDVGRDIIAMVVPVGPIYQAGTLSGNSLAMTAGIKILELLQNPGTYEYLNRITQKLSDGFITIAQKAGHAIYGSGIGAMFGLFFTEGPVRNYNDAKKSELHKFSLFQRIMLEHGIYLSPSQSEAGFTPLAHSDEDIDRTLETARKVFATL